MITINSKENKKPLKQTQEQNTQEQQQEIKQLENEIESKAEEIEEKVEEAVEQELGIVNRELKENKGDSKFIKYLKIVWSFIKPYLAFSKLLSVGVLLMDFKISMVTLDLCYLAINTGSSNTLPYLVSLIGAYQLVTGTVLTAMMNKSTKENSVGGVTYDLAMKQLEMKQEVKRDC